MAQCVLVRVEHFWTGTTDLAVAKAPFLLPKDKSVFSFICPHTTWHQSPQERSEYLKWIEILVLFKVVRRKPHGASFCNCNFIYSSTRQEATENGALRLGVWAGRWLGIEGISCSSTGPRINSKHLQSDSQPPVTPVKEDQTPLLTSVGPNIHVHKINKCL